MGVGQNWEGMNIHLPAVLGFTKYSEDVSTEIWAVPITPCRCCNWKTPTAYGRQDDLGGGAFLSHPMVGQGPIAPFPTMPQHQTVSNLLGSALNCSDDELRQLIFDLYELGKFSHFGVHDNVIPWKGQMKTSLHSCGNQLSGCPCGCRKFPFTESRLAQGRLNGLPPF